MRLAGQVTVQPLTETPSMASQINGLDYLEPVQLDDQDQHIHVDAGIVRYMQPQAFYVLISSFNTKRVHLKTSIVVAQTMEPPLLPIN